MGCRAVLEYNRTNTGVVLLFVVVIVLFFDTGFGATAKSNIRERDTSGDGNIDQRAHFDRVGEIELLEVDSDHDGRMDRLQYYVKGQIVKVDSDSDDDGKVDGRDLFADGRRTIHQRFSYPGGKIVEIVEFDDCGQPTHMAKDTGGNGHYDTNYFFQEGKLARVTRDLGCDDVPDEWISYRNNLPHQQWRDSNGDANIEMHLWFDKEGQPEKSVHDNDEDGWLEEERHYQAGVITWQGNDLDRDSFWETVTSYRDGKPFEQQRDTNGDRSYDVVTTFSNSLPECQKKDRNFNQKFDWFCKFDGAGKIARVEEDSNESTKPERVRIFHVGVAAEIRDDSNEDGWFETITELKNDLPCKQVQDSNGDRRMDVTILFDAKGVKKQAEIDVNYNDKPDTWEYYEKGQLVRVDQDPDEQGWVLLREHYAAGDRVQMEMDRDGDGYFEMVRRFDDRKWDVITEYDENGDDHVDERVCELGGTTRLRQVDNDSDGRIDLEEEFDEAGSIVLLREDFGGAGRLDLVWHYDREGEPQGAEQDMDGDARPDVWFRYEAGRCTQVAEDTDHNGVADLWEDYDAAELLIARSRDYDGDGQPDFKEQL